MEDDEIQRDKKITNQIDLDMASVAPIIILQIVSWYTQMIIYLYAFVQKLMPVWLERSKMAHEELFY